MAASRVTRRDFIDGFACSVLATRAGRAWSQDAPYPPGRSGYLGSRPADFEVAHAVRDGRRYDLDAQPVGERCEVVVIGAGLGGLACAHYLRRARPAARILLLDNHDEFGGHARRNEFSIDGRLLLGYGGSESLDSPRARWSRTARECVAALGVELDRFNEAYHSELYPGLGLSLGLFFPRESFGVDRLVTGDPIRTVPSEVPAARYNARSAEAFLADCPIDQSQRARLLELLTGQRDVLAGMSGLERQRLIDTTSYHDYLARFFGLDARSLAMFDGLPLDLFGWKAQALPASWAWACQYPGFRALGLPQSSEGRDEDQPYICHFPDGNASLARLFVRELIPQVAPGRGMQDIVTARFDYRQLDVEGRPVRLRLSATAVALANRGGGVDVMYVQGGREFRVHAGHAIYAGYSAMLPYICAELGGDQRAAVAAQVRAPLCYVNVLVRNWQPWVRQGVHYINNPTGFYSVLKLDYPVSMGDYRFPTHPDEPMVLHLVHVPWVDGSGTDLRQELRAARGLLYSRSFEDFELHARDELSRMLGAGGFDADRDIAAITVNRWGHGYAYTPQPLADPPAAGRQVQLSARPLGRIHFAGTDAVWDAYADRAIDSAHRAVAEVTG
jgi:spermidine dehydrogenase